MDYYNNLQNIHSSEVSTSLPLYQPNVLNYASYYSSDQPLHSTTTTTTTITTPPITTQPPPNYVPLSNEENVSVDEDSMKTDDELWIETWLSKIGKIRINLNITEEIKSKEFIPFKSNIVQIHSVKNSLKNSIQILNNLQTSQQYLKENAATMSSAEWKKKTMEIGLLKEQLSKNMLQFENTDSMNKIQKAVEQRKKKRQRQHNRRKLRAEEMAKKIEKRQKAHKDIDRWLESIKDDVERVKQDENLKKDADCVLAEVTKKKSDARKSLALLSSLIKLRQVREHFATQRGEKTSLEDHNAFVKVTDHLVKIWKEAMKVYSKEEQGLRIMLEQNAVEDTNSARIATEKKIIQEWETALFGPKWIPNSAYLNLTAGEKDLESFIAVRKSWDTFYSESEGTKIPIGWVLPNPNANEDWSKYLSS